MSFGEKLTKLRKEKGMSQEDLANNLNVSRQAVSKWESNNSYPETEKIVAICKLFNCSMDELIGLKEGKVKSENKTLNIINEYFDKFIKGIKMFYAMTFKQKLKCLIEMGFYFLILFVLFLIADIIIVEIVRKLLYLLPGELLMILIQIFEGLFYIVYIAFMIYALVKLYKVRYLDYYENYLEDKDKNIEVVNEEKQENIKKIKIKEEKIIIRDNTEFKPFTWLKKSLIIFSKMIALFCSIGLGVAFVLLIACIIFVLYFIDAGILILYIACALLGALLGIYIFIELFVKFIFNMKQSPKRLFIMFIIAMLIVGISSGFFGCELTTFKLLNEPEYNNKVYEQTIEMSDNVVLNFLNYSDVEIIFEERDDILVELYGTDKYISDSEIYEEDIYCKLNEYSSVKHLQKYYYDSYYDYFNGTTFNTFIRSMLESIKDKEIVSEEYYYQVVPKIYISKDNFNKLKAIKLLSDRCSYHMNEYYE